MEKHRVFSSDDFSQLRFLEGRWQGAAPDGSTFFEQYDFPEESLMRSRRFTDAAFAQAGDSSTVAWRDGTIISRWGKYSWRAVEVAADKVCFEPIEAPSSFCWQRIGADTVHVTQRWMDESGKPQEYVVPLRRL
jgi:hypothetical protein